MSAFFKRVKEKSICTLPTGNVGTAFINLLRKQQKMLLEEHRLDLKIVGICNSKKMLIDPNGLSSRKIDHLNKNGTSFKKISEYINLIKSARLRNSIFIDNTASQDVSKTYATLLEHNISIATCNKIACASDYSNYQNLQQLAKDNNRQFQYETTVGAALPIVRTIQDLILAGDEITKIQAVLSGSLNFIFNAYDGSKTFASVVRQAMKEGYTEPNPLIDLSGLDVMRKILILSRESGLEHNLKDVSFKGFLPKSCANAKSVNTLFSELEKHESHFKKIYDKAHKKGKKLKVIASLDKGKMRVELKEVASESAFYHLAGKDNIVAINTTRYPEDPVIIRGAGAGAEVTASGVFSDLMLIIKK